MFGSTPNVGVMNPLQGKPGMGQPKTGAMPPIGGARGPSVGGLGLGGKSVSAAPKPPAA